MNDKSVQNENDKLNSTESLDELHVRALQPTP